MDNSKLEVNTGTLRSDSASVRTEISALKREAQSLRNLSARLSQMWEGTAKAEFQKHYEAELNALDEAISALERFTQRTQEVGTEYERCERAVSSVVGGLKI